MELNPYQTPSANVEGVTGAALARAEDIRKKHISHEASIRSISLLYYLGMVALAAIGVAAILDFDTRTPVLSLLIIAVLFGIAALYFWIGTGLRALRQNVRVVAGIFAGIGLLSFPVGTIINGYILYLLFSEKGKMIFSDEYQSIVDATPHIKYKTSIIIWIFLALLILMIGAVVVIPMMNR